MNIDLDRLEAAIATTRRHLLSLRAAGPYWEGYLSSSAVATATAVMALALAGGDAERTLVKNGAKWLARTQNGDGGWGDTPDSPSNIAATLLSMCALTVAEAEGADALRRSRAYLAEIAGDRPEAMVRAVRKRYGSDRTFQAPILAACALAGLISWRDVPELPFELAMMPRSFHRLLRLEVVSYALPALIAVGACIHRHAPSRNPFVRLLRTRAIAPALRRLPSLQPESGGFLEAAPLTSFVAMTLADVAGTEHEVVRSCRRFLRATVRADGSWPIDTNLSVWVTTNALNALRCSGGVPAEISRGARNWLLEVQQSEVHPLTGAAPGGWPWTHLPGGVPDADDTASTLLVLADMGEREAAMAGAFWLIGLNNPDGGWPTFCQGWGRLPFDRSSPDITAHALRALQVVSDMPTGEPEPYIARLADANLERFTARGFRYLQATQREDGSWNPLWFGNQNAPGQHNPVFGTARVLAAYADCRRADEWAARRGVDYLLRVQNEDGGWGGAEGVASSIEETAVATSALCRFGHRAQVKEAIGNALTYLLARVEDGSWTEATPIGLYFASLWYAERLYPVIWTVEALGRARAMLHNSQ